MLARPRLSPGTAAPALRWGRRAVWLAIAAGLAWAQPLAAAPPGDPPAPAPAPAPLSAQERQQILSLGPWPPAPRRDPGNRVSGRRQAIELGRRLFSDPRMSSVGYIGCVSCHQPDRGFSDLKPRAHGLADLPRNTPGLDNLAGRPWYGWGGASDSLWMASIRPILDGREFDGSAAIVVRLFERDAELAACYRQVFGVTALRQPQRTLVNVGKALAAFIETRVTARTPFDAFRDALARGDPDGLMPPAYPEAALRGLRRFVGSAGCVRCHGGPNFSDDRFHRVALPAGAAPPRAGLDDDGRQGDARLLLASPYNLLGPANDDRSRRNAAATQALVAGAALRGRFRTPSLRNVAVSAPYFHAGQVDRLDDAVAHGRPDGAPPAPVEVQDLVAFLATLTDAHGLRRPWPAAAIACP